MKITKRQLRRIIRESISQYGNDDRIENHPERDELMDAIFNKFGLKPRTTEEFGISSGGVWLSAEGGGDTASDGVPLFDSYAGGMGPYDDFGVHTEFNKFIQPYGFFAEWYDPGTLMLWEM